MRFGVVVAGPAMARAAWLDEVRRIDDLGFDLLLVPDHLGLPPPFPPLVAAAEASDRLRFGVQVLNNEFWNPVLLARDVIGVDLLTDGRLEVGLGAGHTKSEFDDVGIIYERPGVRISRLEHDVAELRWVLDAGADGPVGFAAAQGHVPIMVGGNGDRVLDIAARRADIVGLNGITSGSGQVHTGLSHFSWDGLADRIAHVRTCAPERFANLTLSILVQAVVRHRRPGSQPPRRWRRSATRIHRPTSTVRSCCSARKRRSETTSPDSPNSASTTSPRSARTPTHWPRQSTRLDRWTFPRPDTPSRPMGCTSPIRSSGRGRPRCWSLLCCRSTKSGAERISDPRRPVQTIPRTRCCVFSRRVGRRVGRGVPRRPAGPPSAGPTRGTRPVQARPGSPSH